MKQQLTLLNSILLLLVLLSACGTTPEQQNATAQKAIPYQDDEIAVIQSECNTTDLLFAEAQLSMDTVHYACTISQQRGKIDTFHYQDEVKLIRHTYYQGDHFGAIENYYLANNQLSYVHVEETTWSFDPDFEPETDGTKHTRDDISEKYFYFAIAQPGQHPAPISCLKKEYVLRSAIELSTNPDEIRNQKVDCSNEAHVIFNRFLDLAGGKYETC
ncbi:MAG: hypothetical protein AAFU67_14360 [Bacteroidota bacterium]